MILSGGWLTAMITLLWSCEKGFKHTFYRPRRGWEYNRALFDTGIDEYRMSIFTDHREYYRWYEDLVKEWLADIWNDMHSKKPACVNRRRNKEDPARSHSTNINHENVRREMELAGKEEGASRRRSSTIMVLKESLREVIVA